jgi:sortase A
MQLQPDTHRGSSGWLRWTARLLILVGAAMLVWCALIVGDRVLAQQRARRSLVLPEVSEPLPLTSSLPPPAPMRALARGEAVAALSIPRIDVSAVVLHGSDAETLRRAPGHVEHSALPGETGNVVIAGHRDTFFWPLRNITAGDDIFLDTPRGRLHYRVAWTRVVRPTDVRVLAPTATPTLTLITCYPFWTVGAAPDRFVVRATAVIPGGAVPEQRQEVVHDDRGVILEAIDRFRTAYNVGRPLQSGGGSIPLVFRACDVTVTEDNAIASCVPPDAPDVWIFTLDRDRPGWGIRSVEVKQSSSG